LGYLSLAISLAAKLVHFASTPIYPVLFFLFNFRAQMFNITVLVLEWRSTFTLERYASPLYLFSMVMRYS
jgi:hypothetical protein